MLVVGSEHKKKKNVQLALDKNSNQAIYWTDDDGDQEIAARPGSGPLALIDPDDLLRVFKKYGLSKKEIRLVVNFYENFEDLGDAVTQSWKLKRAFEDIEQLMIQTLKTTYIDPTADLIPWFDGESLRSCAFVAASNAGKTWMATDILLRPELSKAKVYVFTMNPEDPSITRLKDRGKRYTIFVDLEKVRARGKPLILERDFPKDSIIFYDDVLDALQNCRDPRKFCLRKTLVALMNRVLVKGRHHRSSRTSRGSCMFLCSHLFKGGRDQSTLWAEVKNVFLFPSASKHQVMDFLKTKLMMHTKDAKRVLKHSDKSRWVCLRLVEKPMAAIFQTGIMLL